MQTDFSDYGVGAVLATDLVNTSPEVRGAGEVLVDAASLVHFLTEHRVIPDALPNDAQPTERDLSQVHALRQEIRSILEANTEDQAVESANALVTRTGVGPVLRRGTEGRWGWHVATAPHASLADELAVLIGTGLLGALHTLGHDRFRHCASPTCHGMFVDTSRAGRRRYCMPDLCGNRVNVANHRARRQAIDATEPR
ncbi:CGNR zinc finger domain-containing protein [Phytoactinopolyspora endophytica]|uniref:CGNR zinc finger domain-containing protein n=1 Tax=Phytoactinopolyspora endophytica TaxID=1642495 RepID=UPI00101E0772|nr:CGNR zinc finger domain-containing protein [Phytoactinopolyspora endophytica]